MKSHRFTAKKGNHFGLKSQCFIVQKGRFELKSQCSPQKGGHFQTGEQGWVPFFQ